MLLVGEFAELAQAVQELSGLDEDINDLIEEQTDKAGRFGV